MTAKQIIIGTNASEKNRTTGFYFPKTFGRILDESFIVS